MVNKHILLGRLGKDPELLSVNDKEICFFSLATYEKYKKDGKTVEKTEWHNIVATDGLAKTCMDFLEKGSMVYLEGTSRKEMLPAQEGKRQESITRVYVNSLKIVQGKALSA